MRPVGRLIAGSLVTGLAATSLLMGPLGVPAAYANGSDCSAIQFDADSEPTTMPSSALTALQITRAQRVVDDVGRAPGEGQTVAVVDSGVAPVGGIRVVGAQGFANTPKIEDYQGTALAGLIAGAPLDVPNGRDDDPPPVGIAPAAGIVDVQVYDALAPSDGQVGVQAERVVAGLTWVAQNARRLGIDIANVSLTLPGRDDALDAAVRAVTEAGVILVASAGDVPEADGLGSDVFLDEEGVARPGIDARSNIWPAGYDEVVAVSASAPPGEDASLSVLQNSQIDIAVPTQGGVSYALNGEPCQLVGTSSLTAAAQVSGILALLKSAHPEETNEQILSRLYRTATGSGSEVTAQGEEGFDPTNDLLTGAGVAQPVEALLRALSPGADGDVETVEIAEDETDAAVPETPPDVLAQVREDAVLFGLLAGGLLVVAVLLRPVLSRRS